MNERMNQLHVEAARYAKEKYPDDIVEWSICMSEKLAELIVKECANRASWAQDTGEKDIGGEVLKHFGVEE